MGRKKKTDAKSKAGRAEQGRAGERRKWIPVLFLFFAALPVVSGFIFVHRYGVNVCHWDNVDIVPLFEKYFNGTLDFSYLFSQHNEHRIIVPRVIHLFLGLVTRYNNVAEMFLIVGCMAISVILLLLPIGTRVLADPRLFFYLPVPFLLMSFRQYQNMLSGFQLSFVLVQTFAVMSLVCLVRSTEGRGKEHPYLLGGIVSAMLSSFSSAQGLLVWPAGVVPIACSKAETAWKKAVLAVWVASGLLVWLAYFWDYTSPAQHPSLATVYHQPLTSLYFFFVLLGNSLFWDAAPAFWAGLFLSVLFSLGLFVSWSGETGLRGREGGNARLWVSLSVFSLLILGSITVGRSGFGIRYAGESRYATYSILGVIGIYGILLGNWISGGIRFARLASWALLAVLLVGILLSYVQGIRAGEGVRQVRSLRAHILSTYRSQPDQILSTYIYPNPAIARERAAYLEKIEYNVFSR